MTYRFYSKLRKLKQIDREISEDGLSYSVEQALKMSKRGTSKTVLVQGLVIQDNKDYKRESVY